MRSTGLVQEERTAMSALLGVVMALLLSMGGIIGGLFQQALIS